MQRALSNVVTNVILQIMIALQGFVISKFVLSIYGSAMNGMVNAISQFLIYAGLAELGVGNAAIVALYAPISGSNWKMINNIVGTVKRKYCLSGMFYIIIVFGIAFLYPMAINGQLDYSFAFFMVIVIGGSNLAEYFILAKYKIFLSADQKYYVLNLARSISIFVTLVVSIILMLNRYSLIVVKGVVAFIRVCEALIIKYYTIRKYPKLRQKPEKTIKINQQNNALLHQVFNIVIYNTDLVVLTICLSVNSLYEISVYTVYAMPCNMMINLLNTLINGVNSTFGDIISRCDREKLRKWYDIYEYMYMIIIFTAYTCFAVMVIPFVRCYTMGVCDINYIRLSIGILFCFSGLTAHIKGAAMVLITGAGHYKETQKYIFAEAVSNIVISLILVRKYGTAGVLVGTIVSHLLANPGYINYANKIILYDRSGKIWRRIGRNSVAFIVLFTIEYVFLRKIDRWTFLFFCGMVVLTINTGVYFFLNIISEPEKKCILQKYVLRR